MSGVCVVGTIERIGLSTIESVIAGVPPRPVTRIALAIERAVDADGRAVDTGPWRGLDFEAAPELATAFSPGQRVELWTTTPSGLHVASIRLAPLA